MKNLNTCVSEATDAKTVKAGKTANGKHLLRHAIKMAVAGSLFTGIMTAPLLLEACEFDSGKPFNSGPYDLNGSQLGMFSEYVVDSNGVGLEICTHLTVCLTEPPVPGNALSMALNRGNEAFYYLLNSTFTSTGAFPIDAVLVLGIESAFLSAEPQVGSETQFQRERIRVNVSKVGIYTVETPWRTTTHRVDTLLRPGNGQNRSEISVPIDVAFGPDASVPGLVTPFLTALSKPGVAAAGLNPDDYIGDGVTLTKVTGSPCGANYVKITAVDLDGVTPIAIGPGGSNVVINDTFTVMGKVAPQAVVPLSIDAAYYIRNQGADSISVMASGSASLTLAAAADATINGVVTHLDREVNRFYKTIPVIGTLPESMTVTGTDTGKPSVPNTQTALVTDLVTISKAEALCTGTGATKSCVLTVNAASSDDGSGAAVPTLTLQHNHTPLVGGVATVTSVAVPAKVTVVSDQGGAAEKSVTIINQ
jgi:hypothetical protein